MTIEEIRSILQQANEELQRIPPVPFHLDTDNIINSIVEIRSNAYNQGWQDAMDEAQGPLNESDPD